MSFKCCLIIRTVAGTLDYCFNNFRHFRKCLNSPSSYYYYYYYYNIIIILVWKGYGKIEAKCIRKNY